MPWPLQEAINHGLTVLNWYENYLEKEIPPEPIWDDGEAIAEWFKAVRKKKDDEMSGGRAPSSDDDEGGDGEGDGSMMGNELADHFRN